MLDDKQFDACSIQELISKLERVEESELQTDIRQNVCAELKRIKRNVSAVLSFVEHSRLPDDPELRQKASEIRRECISINAMISRILLLYLLRLSQNMCNESTERVLVYYRGMSEATCSVCQVLAPSLTSNLAEAL